MICPNCGQETLAGSVFCDNCGIKLNASADVSQMSNFDSEPIDVMNYTPTVDPIIDTESTPFFTPTIPATPAYEPMGQAAPSFTPTAQAAPAYEPMGQAAPSFTPTAPAAPVFEPMGQAAPVFAPPTPPNPVFGAAAKNFTASQEQSMSAVPPMPQTIHAPQPAPQPVRPAAAPQPSPFFDAEQLYQPVSVGNWIGTFILLGLIPLAVGVLTTLLGNYFISDAVWQSVILLLPSIAYLVMLFVYAFNGKVNPSKRNLFRAVLILSLITIIIIGILIVVFSTVLSSYLSEMGDVNQLVDFVNSIPV